MSSPFVIHTLTTDHQGVRAGVLTYRQIGPTCYVLTLWVSSAHRRKGIARDLMQRVLAIPGVKTVLLDVAISNQPARRLFTSLGFAVVGSRRGGWLTLRLTLRNEVREASSSKTLQSRASL